MVSAVRRDSTSPVRVTSKNAGVRPSTLVEHRLADIGDDALADPGHEIEARGAGNAHHRGDRDEGEEILADAGRPARHRSRGRSGRARRRQDQGRGRGNDRARSRPWQSATAIGLQETGKISRSGLSDQPLGAPVPPGRPVLHILRRLTTWPDFPRFSTYIGRPFTRAKGPSPLALSGPEPCPYKARLQKRQSEGLRP